MVANEMNEFVNVLERIGVIESILPFMVIFGQLFVLLFVVLQITQLVEGRRQFKTFAALVVSMVTALGAVIPHLMGLYPQRADIVVIINSVLPSTSVSIVIVLAALLLTAVGLMYWVTGDFGSADYAKNGMNKRVIDDG